MKPTASLKQSLRRPIIASITNSTKCFAALLIDTPIEEETLPGYRPDLFYPTHLGEIINNRYRIITKLGFGATSTVWLARDHQKWPWQSHRWVTVKLLCRGYAGSVASALELEISRRITATHPKSEGQRYLRTVLDSFEVAGPHGSHLGLVYEPMRESLSTFQRRLPEERLPAYLLKPLLAILLKGIDYLHTRCQIIHTDLKPDNLLLGLESHAAIEEVVKRETEEPSLCKMNGTRAIYASRNFGDLQKPPGPPKIADFGLSVSGDANSLHRHPIQATLFQAPEVILDAGWTYSADIWNLGAMLWDLVEDETLFDAADPVEGSYSSVERHLQEMTVFLGPPPNDLLRRAKLGSTYFTAEGKLLRSYNDVETAPSLEANLMSFVGEEKRLFLAFLRRMLKWDPEDRASAHDLLQDPWLNS